MAAAVFAIIELGGCSVQKEYDASSELSEVAANETEQPSEVFETGELKMAGKESVETVEEAAASEEDQAYVEYVNYYFRNTKLLNQHFEKHGKEMGFETPESYEKAASNVINNPDALSKTEKEDGDYVFYIVETNEFVVLSTDGYIRTYFKPDAGKKYYDNQ